MFFIIYIIWVISQWCFATLHPILSSDHHAQCVSVLVILFVKIFVIHTSFRTWHLHNGHYKVCALSFHLFHEKFPL